MELFICWGSIQMSMFSLFRPFPLLFFFLAAFSFPAFSAAPWYVLFSGYDGQSLNAFFADPDTACRSTSSTAMELWYSHLTYPYQNSKISYLEARYISPTSYSCIYQYVDGVTGAISQTGIGQVAYQVSSQCVSGDSATITWPFGIYDSSSQYGIISGTQISPPSSFCSQGCSASTPSSPSCYQTDSPSVSGSSITYCDYSYKLTGSVCNTSDNPDAPIPTAPASSGGDTGGTTGGDTGGTTGGDSGDTGGTAGGDTGSTTGGDTGGTTGGDTGSTTGGDTGGTTGGDTGSTTGGDTGGTTGGGASLSSVSGGACDQPLTCSGDAIQCALLDQQKAIRCSQEAAWDYSKKEGDIKSLVSGPDFQMNNSEVQAPSLFDEQTRWLSASCPPDESFNLSFAGGRTFSFSYEPICRVAGDLSYLIVALATLAAALYIGRSFGGG